VNNFAGNFITCGRSAGTIYISNDKSPNPHFP
jgi:hypothetical protein